MEVVLTGSNSWKLKDNVRIWSGLPKFYEPMHYLKNSAESDVGWISSWQTSLKLLMTRQNCHLSWSKLVTMNFSYLHWWRVTITLTTLLPPTPLPDLQYAIHSGREMGTFHQCSWCRWQLCLGDGHWWKQCTKTVSRLHIVRTEWVT